MFFFGLDKIGFVVGSIKPCVSSFGADEFDEPKRALLQLVLVLYNTGAYASSTFIVWVQDN